MTHEEYYEEIIGLLDDAACDKSLSTEDYAELCGDVWTDAQMRCEAAEADLEKQKKQ
jgi:hypothetical protein